MHCGLGAQGSGHVGVAADVPCGGVAAHARAYARAQAPRHQAATSAAGYCLECRAAQRAQRHPALICSNMGALSPQGGKRSADGREDFVEQG